MAPGTIVMAKAAAVRSTQPHITPPCLVIIRMNHLALILVDVVMVIIRNLVIGSRESHLVMLGFNFYFVSSLSLYIG